MSIEERVAAVAKLEGYLTDNADTIAKAVTDTVGKPLAESLAEIKATVELTRLMCQYATTELRDEVIVSNDMVQKVIAKEPVGVAMVAPLQLS